MLNEKNLLYYKFSQAIQISCLEKNIIEITIFNR